jgi:hypothetical protein
VSAPEAPDPRPRDAMAESVAALMRDLGARAAGLWRVVGDRLEQVAFVAGPGLPAEVARAFAEATRSVALDREGLGIVRAATGGGPAVSRADALPADSGSGLWLRAFGASRSVAVPVRDRLGDVVAVVSVALPDGPPDDQDVAALLRDAASSWGPIA